jgi:hypothetical protein
MKNIPSVWDTKMAGKAVFTTELSATTLNTNALQGILSITLAVGRRIGFMKHYNTIYVIK